MVTFFALGIITELPPSPSFIELKSWSTIWIEERGKWNQCTRWNKTLGFTWNYNWQIQIWQVFISSSPLGTSIEGIWISGKGEGKWELKAQISQGLTKEGQAIYILLQLLNFPEVEGVEENLHFCLYGFIALWNIIFICSPGQMRLLTLLKYYCTFRIDYACNCRKITIALALSGYVTQLGTCVASQMMPICIPPPFLDTFFKRDPELCAYCHRPKDRTGQGCLPKDRGPVSLDDSCALYWGWLIHTLSFMWSLGIFPTQ